MDKKKIAANVIKKGEALYAKLSTEQIECIKENLEINNNASGYSLVADEVEDQELSDQLRMLELEIYSYQNNHFPIYDDLSTYVFDMEYYYDTLHSLELRLSSMKIFLKMALVTQEDSFFADDFVCEVFDRLEDYGHSNPSFVKCGIDALVSIALDSKECAACYSTASSLACRFRDSDDKIDFEINVIKELFISAIGKCSTTEDFFFARGAIRNAYLDPDITGELLSRIPDDL